MLNISLHKNDLLRSVIDKTAAGKLQACVNGKSEPFESLKQLIPFVQTLHLRWICKTSAKFHDNCCQGYWKQNGKTEDAMEKRQIEIEGEPSFRSTLLQFQNEDILVIL